jgi:serine-type D-Ala-D-Ala carboxypeptidase/endopeptidase
VVIATTMACSKVAPRGEERATLPSTSAAPSVARAAPAPDDASRPADELDAIAQRLRVSMAPQIGAAKGKNVGAIVALCHRGKTRFLSFGETRSGSGTAPDESSVFEVGSLTKTFTGLMLADAIESGAAQESDRLDTMRPEWKGAPSGDIRLIDLVTHRSGLAPLPCNFRPTDPKRPYAHYSEDELVRALATCPIETHPTNKIEYSNWGFATLGYVLSRARNVTYPELLRTRITEPLGLRETTYALSDAQQRRVAQGYDADGNATPLWDRSVMFGNGAIRSTAADLVKYGVAILHPENASTLEPALRRVTRPQYGSGGSRIAYAWFVTAKGSLWHNGMTGGYASFMKVYPAQDLVVMYLTNTARSLVCFVETVEDVACHSSGKK